MAAMSILPIVIIAANTRCATAGSGSLIPSTSTRGVICQDRPHLSLHQPQALACPPLPTIASQSRSVSAWSSVETWNENASLCRNVGPPFNPMQAMTYQIVMLVLLPLQFYTGVLLWDSTGWASHIELLGGLRVISTVHVLLTIAFIGFLMSHLYLVTLGHTFGAHTKGMITGYEEVDDEPADRDGTGKS